MSALIIVILLVLCLGLTVLAGVLLVMYRSVNNGFTTVLELSHGGCTQQVADLVSAKHDAMLLRNLADEYDAVENQAVLARIQRENRGIFIQGDRDSIPSLWLRLQADRLDPPRFDHNEVAEYNLAGDRLV